MKQLHLMRHAKSSWADSYTVDHDRELNERGKRDAPRMGSALAKQLPVLPVYVSSARRAQDTLAGLCAGWPGLLAQPHTVESDLYTFDWEEVLEWIQDLASDDEHCFLIGHNPALTELCNALTGRRSLDNLPTAGYLRFSLPIDDWSDTAEGLATLESYLFPKQL